MQKEKIKPVGYLKTTKNAKSHIPELIRRETGVDAGGQIPYVINASTVLLYNPNLSLKDLLASIDVLKRDVKLRRGNTKCPHAKPVENPSEKA